MVGTNGVRGRLPTAAAGLPVLLFGGVQLWLGRRRALHFASQSALLQKIQAAGLSLVFGSFLGDFVGGGAVVFAAESLLKSAYSRHKEAAADDYAVRTMQALNANPRALATFLARIAGSSKRSRSAVSGSAASSLRACASDVSTGRATVIPGAGSG